MKAVLKSVSVMVLGSGTQLAANALAGMLATVWLPVGERGLMILILSAAAIVALFSGAGIGNVLRARLPRMQRSDADGLVASFTGTGALVVVLSAVLGAGVSYALVGVDGRMATPAVAATMALAVAAQVATNLLTDARFARNQFSPGARWAAVSALAGVATMSMAFLAVAAAGAEGTAVLLTACQFGGVALVATLSATAALRAGALRGGRGDRGAGIRMLGAGIATMALPLALVLITRGDRLVLGANGTLAAVAVYGLAATYCEMLRIIPTAVGQLALPRVAAGGGVRTVARLAGLSLVLTTTAAAVLYAAVALLTVPFFGAEYAEAVPLTLLLIPGEILYALVVLANLVLIGGQWSTMATAAGVASLPVAFVLFWWGAEAGGGAGLAIARSAVFLLMAVGLAVIVVRCLRRART